MKKKYNSPNIFDSSSIMMAAPAAVAAGLTAKGLVAAALSGVAAGASVVATNKVGELNYSIQNLLVKEI